MGKVLKAITQDMQCELLGTRVVDAKKNLYKQNVSSKVLETVKKVAYQFNSEHDDLKIRRKIGDFKFVIAVIRGRNIEGTLEKIYERDIMKFKREVDLGLEELHYKTMPSVLFMTNHTTKQPMLDFIINSKFIQLFEDISRQFHFKNEDISFFHREQKTFRTNAIIDSLSFGEIKSSSQLVDHGLQP